MPLPEWMRAARGLWRFRGQERPSFAIEPSEGQESVWDYPRPPRLVVDKRLVEVRLGELLIASTTGAVRVLETASPPTFYIPPADVVVERLRQCPGSSHCEWKGRAEYWGVVDEDDTLHRDVGWSYPEPTQEFADIAGYLSFYPAHLECVVAGERVQPQPGGFYGGWVTSEVIGPYKGESGTGGW